MADTIVDVFHPTITFADCFTALGVRVDPHGFTPIIGF
jgi:hypothetical protein